MLIKLIKFNVQISWLVGFCMSFNIIFYPNIGFTLVQAWFIMMFSFSYAVLGSKLLKSRRRIG